MDSTIDFSIGKTFCDHKTLSNFISTYEKRFAAQLCIRTSKKSLDKDLAHDYLIYCCKAGGKKCLFVYQ